MSAPQKSRLVRTPSWSFSSVFDKLALAVSAEAFRPWSGLTVYLGNVCAWALKVHAFMCCVYRRSVAPWHMRWADLLVDECGSSPHINRHSCEGGSIPPWELHTWSCEMLLAGSPGATTAADGEDAINRL